MSEFFFAHWICFTQLGIYVVVLMKDLNLKTLNIAVLSYVQQLHLLEL